MKPVFVDTSALLGLLQLEDECHGDAARAFDELRRDRRELITTSYVILETYALVSRRFGLQAVKEFRADVAPLLDVVWIHEDLHDRGLDLLLDRGNRNLSLVDAVSFLVMRQHGIREAFTFDSDFDLEGFERIR